VVAGLAVLLLAITPYQVLRSQRDIQSALADFRAGDCPGAARGALSALDALNSRTEPFELLGYCDVRVGKSALAVRMLQAADRRDPGNWELLYGLALARATAGQDPRPALRAAARVGSDEPLVQDALRRMRGTSRRRWDREARRSKLPIPPAPVDVR
jgi:Flp pilus assembly protein TadD